MKLKILMIPGTLALVLAVLAVFYFYSRNGAQDAGHAEARPEIRTNEKTNPPAVPPVKTAGSTAEPGEKSETPKEDLKTVEGVKQRLYHLNIEYAEDLDLLDDLVQPSAANPPALWSGNWVSADDWKRYDDTFRIEMDNAGGYRFTPESDGPKSYTYDKDSREFVWETDYYGKIITSRARFITSDVMVLTKISGDKAMLDIYRRDVPPAPENP